MGALLLCAAQWLTALLPLVRAAQGTARLVSVLGEAANSLQGGVELRKHDKKFAPDSMEPTPQNCAKLAADADTLAHFDALLADWCTQTQRLLEDSDNARREPEDAGPTTELSFWRERMAKLNSLLEQLKSRSARLVLETCTMANTVSMATWRAMEGRLNEAVSEVKDNVKYLTTLEKSFELLYTSTPAVIIEHVPALINNIKMMHTIARYYGTPARMSLLFAKVTVQMIANCRAYILAPGKLYDQDKPTLLKNLQARCVAPQRCVRVRACR